MNREEIYRENYEALLLGYAAGALDMAQHFIVAAHISLSPQARRFVRQCEAVGGALMERECAPAPMREDSLHKALDMLGRRRAAPPQQKRPSVELPEGLTGLPPQLLDLLACRPCRPRWRSHMPGLEMFDLPVQCASGVRFIRARPAALMPHHAHDSLEITLVLQGACADEFGAHERGELMLADESCEHSTNACPERGVIAVVVSSECAPPTGFAGLISRLKRF